MRDGLGAGFSAFALEKVGDELGALVLEHALGDCGFRVERVGIEGVIPPLVVGRSKDDPSDLAPSQRAGAHQARFHRHIDGAVVEVFAAEVVCCRRDGLHLGVRGDIGKCFGEVVRACDDLSAAHDNRSDGHFVAFERTLRLIERHVHESFVGGHRFLYEYLLHIIADDDNVDAVTRQVTHLAGDGGSLIVEVAVDVVDPQPLAVVISGHIDGAL